MITRSSSTAAPCTLSVVGAISRACADCERMERQQRQRRFANMLIFSNTMACGCSVTTPPSQPNTPIIRSGYGHAHQMHTRAHHQPRNFAIPKRDQETITRAQKSAHISHTMLCFDIASRELGSYSNYTSNNDKSSVPAPAYSTFLCYIFCLAAFGVGWLCHVHIPPTRPHDMSERNRQREIMQETAHISYNLLVCYMLRPFSFVKFEQLQIKRNKKKS